MKYKYLPKMYGDVLCDEEICVLLNEHMSNEEVLATIYGLNTFPEVLEEHYAFYDRNAYSFTPNRTIVIVRIPA